MEQMNKWLENYIDHCKQKNLSSKTTKAYCIDLKQYISFLQTKNQRLTSSSIKEYIMTLHENYQPRSAKRKLAAIKAWCSYLIDNGLITEDPFYRWNVRIRQPATLPKTIPMFIIQAMLQKAHDAVGSAETNSGMQRASLEAAILELLFATGIRVSEACGLMASDVDLMEGCIRVHGKGSKERIIQIVNNEVMSSLTKYKQQCPSEPSEFFFKNRLGNHLSDQSVRQIVRKYALKSGSNLHITPHMFRHSFATQLLDADIDIRYIQSFLGHSSISTTQIYTYVAAAKQRDILAAKHPRNKFHLNSTPPTITEEHTSRDTT